MVLRKYCWFRYHSSLPTGTDRHSWGRQQGPSMWTQISPIGKVRVSVTLGILPGTVQQSFQARKKTKSETTQICSLPLVFQILNRTVGRCPFLKSIRRPVLWKLHSKNYLLFKLADAQVGIQKGLFTKGVVCCLDTDRISYFLHVKREWLFVTVSMC